MKNLRTLILLLVGMLILTISSCKKEQKPEPEDLSTLSKFIVGKWNRTSPFGQSTINYNMELRADRTYTITSSSGTVENTHTDNYVCEDSEIGLYVGTDLNVYHVTWSPEEKGHMIWTVPGMPGITWYRSDKL